ncbi:uncharacterized protein TNIN_94431 [Trichonephila inaurata madagascariensis]|uniref:Gustatory receptor n=1 Tax=Trichonephila inaurata madagascariensis TaxID=2747483 RepID=A0A8X7C731_9ARAC|nr:uncharacterized protein TNIN_94431 [Trichonephila inaurata madagascariensis]
MFRSYYLKSQVAYPKKVDFNSFKHFAPEFYNMPRFLFVVLRWAGLVRPPKMWRQLLAHGFDILLLASCVDAWVNVLSDLYFPEKKITVAFLSAYAVSLVMWLTMRRQSRQIASLLRRVQEINSFPFEKRVDFLMLLNACTPLVYPIFLILCSIQPQNSDFYVYGYGGEQILLMYVKNCLTYLVYPFTVNTIALLFAFLCLRCSHSLRVLTRKVDQSPTDAFGLSRQLDVLRSRAKIHQVLLDVQAIFSVPVFFLVVANILMCSSIAGWFLVKEWEETALFLRLEFAYDGIASIVCAASTLWIAGGLPIEMNKFKEAFYQKTHFRLLYYRTKEEQYLKKELFYAPEFVLMGCDILSLRRSTILALVGTLLTYTVLVMSSNPSQIPLQ